MGVVGVAAMVVEAPWIETEKYKVTILGMGLVERWIVGSLDEVHSALVELMDRFRLE